MSLTLATWATAGTITAGWSVLTSTILLSWEGGRRQPSVAGFGATAALPAMVPTCSWSPVTHSTPAVIGWAAKRLSVCKAARLGPVSLPTIGCLLIGFRSITVTPIWAV